jgi:hypothetical protein
MTHDRQPAAAHQPVLSRRRRLVIGVLTAVCIANVGVLTLTPGMARGTLGVLMFAAAVAAFLSTVTTIVAMPRTIPRPP